MKKAFLTLSLVSCLGLFLSYPLLTSAHDSLTEEAIVVHIDERGFSPKEITIPFGTTIMFENTGTAEHWLASDNHPSHSLYTGTTLEEHCTDDTHHAFDSCAGIKPGESWSFTFATPGTHTYHDHLWSHFTGTITVSEDSTLIAETSSESFSLLKTIRDLFQSLLSMFVGFFSKTPTTNIITLPAPEDDVYKRSLDHYQTLTLTDDPKVAIATLERNATTDDTLAAICHDVLHVIGKTAYSKYGSFEEAVSYQNDYCNSGYIHGLFEAYFQSDTASSTSVATICDSYGATKTPFHTWQCYHGVGHGFMYDTGGDLDASLEHCVALEGAHSGSCINGVYMEVFNAEIVGKEREFVDSNNPFHTCAERAIAKSDCYLYAPSYYSQTLRTSYEDIIAACATVEVGYRDACIAGVSTEAMKRNMNTPDIVFDLCAKESLDTTRNACGVGAINVYLFQTGNYESGIALCETISPEFKELCSQVVATNRDFFANTNQQ